MKLLIVITAALVLVPSAVAGFNMKGEGATRHWAWVHAAQANVPLPNADVVTISGWNARATFGWFGRYEITLPRPGRGGWDYHDEHGLLLHELGHLFDAADMTPALRLRFRELAGTACLWNAHHCISDRWVSGPGVTVDVAPIEMFAEMYAACALGLTVAEYGSALFNTYGWVPPRGTDAALCDVIRAAAFDAH